MIFKFGNGHRVVAVSRKFHGFEKLEMMGAGGLAIEESLNEKSGPKLESKADVALEWSDVTIKFRVITQDQSNAEEFELFPNLGKFFTV